MQRNRVMPYCKRAGKLPPLNPSVDGGVSQRRPKRVKAQTRKIQLSRDLRRLPPKEELCEAPEAGMI